MTKEILAIIAVLLTFAGYIPYIRDTINHKTTPHVYTWFIWGLVTSIAFGLQVTHKAGPGAYVTLAAAIVTFIIFGFGIRQGSKNVTKTDATFLTLSLLALALWLFAKQPVLSVILLSTVTVLGFIPTIRKSWHKPHEETLVSYLVNTFRFFLALLALDHYTIITMLYPLTWAVANGGFSIYLMARRKRVTSNPEWSGQ